MVNKQWFTHTVVHYLAKRRSKLLIHATTWMNLKMIILCEKSQIKSTYCMIPFIKYSKKWQLTYSDREQTGSLQGMGSGDRSRGDTKKH